MSTFMPEIHGAPTTLTVNAWPKEGVQVLVTQPGGKPEVTCQGRSVNDLLLAIEQYLESVGVPVTIVAKPEERTQRAGFRSRGGIKLPKAKT